MPELSELIEVKHLKKYFDTKHGTLHAVDDVSFSIAKGETLGVVGESGCGKSTLGRMLVHMHSSTDGQILYNGKDITHLKKKELSEYRRKMQIIFQDPYSSLNPRMTVGQVLEEALRNAGVSHAQLETQVFELMDTVGLARRYLDTYPHELDGGRRQRIGIGRALAMNPEFIVCDEPVSALDVSIQAQVLNLMLDLQEQRNLTYMFITHDLSVVKYISHHILVMYLGQMVEKSSAKELFSHHYHPYTKALLSAVPVADPHHEKKRILLKGELTSPINPKPGCRFASRCLYATEKCFQQSPVMEEIRPSHFVSCHNVREINQM